MAIECAAPTAYLPTINSSGGSRMSARAGSPIQPSASDASVMPNCVAAIYASRCETTCSAAAAPKRPSSTSS